MPRIPKLRKHSTRNLCFVQWRGKRRYLGPPGEETERAYHEWVAATFGRQRSTPGPVLVWHLMRDYAAYQKSRSASQHSNFLQVQRLMSDWDSLPADKFGPLALQSLRAKMVAKGWARSVVNKRVRLLQSCWKWGVSQELVSITTAMALTSVAGLRATDTEAPDHGRRKPVPWSLVDATAKHLDEPFKSIVLLLWHTGARPSNVCRIRPCEIDTTCEPWCWRPVDHKMAHKGSDLTIWLGPHSRELLTPHMHADADAYCFPSPRANGKPCRAGAVWEAVDRVTRRENLQHWTPYQLRHARATAIRAAHGIEAAQAVLGQANVATTEIYAQTSAELARRVVEQDG